ncbi:hypothetical protein [Bacteroides sp.]|uniref:DUF7659 family protein n=1 Tax=Bacteroides sp. TaxID=29523 RepID=UPI002A81F99C|nr:hypothetical protein [Bacteroides sp.]
MEAQEFEFTENWDNEGMLDYKNDRTLNRYRELCKEQYSVDVSKYDCFFAFSNEQFAQGLKSIRPLKEGEKLVSIGGGGYGTKDGAKRLVEFCDNITERIKAECNPQEVYVYEYNNHECFFAYDGDLPVIKLIASIWGDETAKKIERKSAFYSLEHLFGKEE